MRRARTVTEKAASPPGGLLEIALLPTPVRAGSGSRRRPTWTSQPAPPAPPS